MEKKFPISDKKHQSLRDQGVIPPLFYIFISIFSLFYFILFYFIFDFEILSDLFVLLKDNKTYDIYTLYKNTFFIIAKNLLSIISLSFVSAFLLCLILNRFLFRMSFLSPSFERLFPRFNYKFNIFSFSLKLLNDALLIFCILLISVTMVFPVYEAKNSSLNIWEMIYSKDSILELLEFFSAKFINTFYFLTVISIFIVIFYRILSVLTFRRRHAMTEKEVIEENSEQKSKLLN